MRNLMLCTLAGLLSPALVWAQSTKEEIHKLKDEIAALQKENARLKNELARIRPLEQLQGQWKPVSAEVGGAAVRFAPGQRFHVKGNIQTTLLDGKPFGDATRLDIDATADPKIIDWIRPNGEVMEGIYKLEGRRLILCFQREDGVKNRPLTFETKRGDNRLLLVYEKED